MKYGIAKHHVTIDRDNFTPGEVIPVKALESMKKDELARLVELGAVEIAGDTEADKAWEEANHKQQEVAAEVTPESITEESASEELEAAPAEDTDDEAMEELEPMALDDDTIIETEDEETAPAADPAAEEPAPEQQPASERKARGRRS